LGSSEEARYKLLLVIPYSILIHSFFSIIFPAGDLSGQQMYLGRTRLVYDNAVSHGWAPGPKETILSQLYDWFNGINFQAALSVVFARGLSIDVLWVHLFLVPVLWGIFTPIATFLITQLIAHNEKASVLASLLISTFPYATYFGSISVPNSLGFIFFFFSLFLMLKYLTSSDSTITGLMVIFVFLSFMAHYLTGTMAISLLIFSVAFKSYVSEKPPSTAGKTLLITSFALSVSLLPLSFIYLRLVRYVPTAFTLSKFAELPPQEIAGLFFLGELIYGFDVRTIVFNVVGPALAFSYVIYLFYKSRRGRMRLQPNVIFLGAAFIIMLIEYWILKLFMTGLPLNEERLWVFRDLTAVPFATLAVYAILSSLNTFLKMKSSSASMIAGFKTLLKGRRIHLFGLLIVVDVLVVVVLSGWITYSTYEAYPQVAPLQTTWYELEAVKYIDQSTHENYVVLGDTWTIYAGEVVVGINNPRAYYFRELNPVGFELFTNMTEAPSPEWMLSAMNYTGANTTFAYFIVTQARLGSEKFNTVVIDALQSEQLTVVNVPGVSPDKLCVFSYKKE